MRPFYSTLEGTTKLKFTPTIPLIEMSFQWYLYTCNMLKLQFLYIAETMDYNKLGINNLLLCTLSPAVEEDSTCAVASSPGQFEFTTVEVEALFRSRFPVLCVAFDEEQELKKLQKKGIHSENDCMNFNSENTLFSVCILDMVLLKMH